MRQIKYMHFFKVHIMHCLHKAKKAMKIKTFWGSPHDMSYRRAYCRNLGSSACRKERSVSVSRDCRCACSGDSWASTVSHSVSTLSNDIDSLVINGEFCAGLAREPACNTVILLPYGWGIHNTTNAYKTTWDFLHIWKSVWAYWNNSPFFFKTTSKVVSVAKTFFRNIIHNFSYVTINSFITSKKPVHLNNYSDVIEGDQIKCTLLLFVCSNKN